MNLKKYPLSAKDQWEILPLPPITKQRQFIKFLMPSGTYIEPLTAKGIRTARVDGFQSVLKRLEADRLAKELREELDKDIKKKHH